MLLLNSALGKKRPGVYVFSFFFLIFLSLVCQRHWSHCYGLKMLFSFRWASRNAMYVPEYLLDQAAAMLARKVMEMMFEKKG